MSHKLGAKFTIFLSLFSVLMAGLIYARETWDNYQVSLLPITLWQLAIWLPLAFTLQPLSFVAERLNRGHSPANFTILLCALMLLIGLHTFWFFWLSNHFSPLNHLPNTGYGVYPYFFIFFAMIDIVILWGLSARIGVFQILEAPPSKKSDDIITVKKGANNILIQPSDIMWITAEDYYSKLHTKKEEHLLRQPLKVLADRLPQEKFVQVHRSTIVNIDFVKEANSKKITLIDGTVRNMSRQGYKRFSEFL